MTAFAAALLNSLDIGMLLFVIASGLTIIFGVLGVLNFAHGALYMIGAYIAYTVTGQMGLPYWLALAVVPLVVAVFAAAAERLVISRIYGRHATHGLLLTFAVLLILDDAVRMVWGAGYHIVNVPAALRGTFTLAGAVYPTYSLFVIAMGAAVGVLLWLFFSRTRTGKRIRAAAIDRDMALAIGIDVPNLYTMVFAGGAWLAALGGVLAAPMRALGPAMGERVIIESFVVVVIGGLGSVPGSLIGALILGALHGFGGRWLPEFDIVLPYLGMAAVLLWRPHGLLGRKA